METSEETYYWKKLADKGSYTLDKSDAQTYPTSELSQNIFKTFPSYELSDFITSFIKKYRTISIPSNISNLIDILIKSNSLKENKLEFYIVACVFQELYIDSIKKPANMDEALMQDVKNEYNDRQVLLGVLFDTLSMNEMAPQSINFKGKPTRTISNHFILNELFGFMIEGYNLTLDNFENRKEEILDSASNFLFDKRDEYLKFLYAKGLYGFISDNDFKNISNSNIKFVGQFLILSQIPIKLNQFEIPKIETLESLLDQDDIKYLNQFISRPKKFFIK